MRAGARRSLLVLLTIVILIAACAGCGATTNPSPTPTAPVVAPTATLAGATPDVSPTLTPTPTAAPTPAPTPASTPSPTSMVCVVAAGDTLWEIAQRYGRSVDELFAANPQLTDRALIRPGDEIAIPSDALHAIWKTMVTGWDTVGRDGITMSGAVVDVGPGTLGEDGRLRLSIRVTGLRPDEAVVLGSVGEYQIVWACGAGPEPCLGAPMNCGWTSFDHLSGTARATTRAVAGHDGAASLMIDLVPAHPVAGSCPTDRRSPWQRLGTSWDPVTVTDAAHGLRLTPDPVITGP